MYFFSLFILVLTGVASFFPSFCTEPSVLFLPSLLFPSFFFLLTSPFPVDLEWPFLLHSTSAKVFGGGVLGFCTRFPSCLHSLLFLFWLYSYGNLSCLFCGFPSVLSSFLSNLIILLFHSNVPPSFCSSFNILLLTFFVPFSCESSSSLLSFQITCFHSWYLTLFSNL